MSDMQMIDPTWAWRPFEPTSERPWDKNLVSHLYRRAGFGVDFATIEAVVKRTPTEVVDEYLRYIAVAGSPANDMSCTGWVAVIEVLSSYLKLY